MTKAETTSSGSARGTHRGLSPRWLGSLVLAAMLVGSIGCAREDDGLSEAVEEVQDEVGDAGDEIRDKAREAKEEIEDEVDDHT